MIFLHGETTNKARVVVENLFRPKSEAGNKPMVRGQIMMVKHFFRLPPQAEGHQVKLFAGLFIGSIDSQSSDGQDKMTAMTEHELQLSQPPGAGPPRRRKDERRNRITDSHYPSGHRNHYSRRTIR